MNSTLRLAFLGDIHGNLPALEAVLSDLDKQAPDAVFLLGDLINRCPWTRDVIDILRQRNWPSVQGNHDLVLAQLNTPDGSPVFSNRNRFPNMHWTWEQLGPDELSYLLLLPHDLLIETAGAPPLRLFHGIPDNPFAGIVPDADEESVSSQIEMYDEPVLICGHTHQPLDRTIKSPSSPSVQRILLSSLGNEFSTPVASACPTTAIPAPNISSWTLFRKTANWPGNPNSKDWTMTLIALPPPSAPAASLNPAERSPRSICVRSKTASPGPATTSNGCATNPTLCAATPKLPSNSTCSPTAPTNGHSSAELPISPGQL